MKWNQIIFEKMVKIFSYLKFNPQQILNLVKMIQKYLMGNEQNQTFSFSYGVMKETFVVSKTNE